MRAILAAHLLFIAQFIAQGAPQIACTGADASLPPRGFGSARFEIKNPSDTEGEFQVEAEISPSLQLTGAAKRTVKLSANAAETIVFNLYAPLGTREGGSLKLKLTDLRTGEIAYASHAFGITPQPALEVRALTINGDPATVLRSRGSASSPWELVLANKGNTPLKIELQVGCSPASASVSGLPSEVALVPGESKRFSAIFQNTADSFTEAVAHVRVQGFHEGEPLEATHHFVRLENYPDSKPAHPDDLYEQLRSTAGFAAGFVDDETVMLQTLETEGLIAPKTLLRFQGQFTDLESPTVSIPGYESRSLMRLSLQAPHWSLEAGEVRHDFGRLLASSERGEGIRASAAITPQFRFTVYAAESNDTFSSKQVGGGGVTWMPDPTHTVELQGLTVRNDPNPRNERWSAGTATWTYAPTKNLVLALGGAYGANSDDQGGALGANLLWRGNPGNMPAELRIESGSGDKNFPGSQGGLRDGRISLALQPAKKLRFQGLYYRSHYERDPFFEETIEERQSITPAFIRRITSSATLLSATWERSLPLTLAYQENSSFQKSEFSEISRERTLNLTVSSHRPESFAMATLRGGTEDRQGSAPVSSSFASIGVDTSFPVKTSRGSLTLQASGRYTHNLEGDDQAVNRTGLWLNAGATFTPGKQTAISTRWTVDAYGYEQGDRALRVRGGIQYRLNSQHSIGLETSYTLQHTGSHRRQETAILFTCSRSFGTPLPWRPIRGSTQGVVFNDLNMNRRQDPGEAGIPDIAVQVGSHRALTGPQGEFYFPVMEPGETALEFSALEGTPLHFSAPPPEHTDIRPGKIGEIAVGIVVPLRVDGVIQATGGSQGSFGVLAQEEGGDKIARSFTRGDGSFSLYLEPGNYRITPEGLDSTLEISPKEVLIVVAPGGSPPPIKFEVKERVREIRRKVFQQQ